MNVYNIVKIDGYPMNGEAPPGMGDRGYIVVCHNVPGGDRKSTQVARSYITSGVGEPPSSFHGSASTALIIPGYDDCAFKSEATAHCQSTGC